MLTREMLIILNLKYDKFKSLTSRYFIGGSKLKRILRAFILKL